MAILKKYQLLLCLFFIISTQFTKSENCFQLIPTPYFISYTKGEGLSFEQLKFITTTTDEKIPVLGNILNQLPRKQTTDIGIILQQTTEDVPESEEGYVLTIKQSGVQIKARSSAGLFYGCRTLEQLMEDSRDFHQIIPAMTIVDFPAISYRAVHWDTKHHLDRMDYYYRMIDKLSYYKINAIIWEIEDKLKYTRRPEIASPHAIDKQEMQALCRYAKERHIEISPLVQGLGHASFILKHHPELRENPKSDWEFCPSEPKTYELQFDLYKDAIEAMPYGKYLHVGGDEITQIGIDDRCKKTGKSAFELQMIWLKKVCDFAIKHGRQPIFWDDMPLKYAGIWELILSDKTEKEVAKLWNTDKLDDAISLFPKNCIYMRWNYGDATQPAHQKLLAWYHEKGLKVMAATAASSGNSPVLPRENTKAEFIKGFSQLVAQNKLEGILATAWDDGSPHLETVMRGYIAQGEFGWNPSARDVKSFIEAHAQREYGLPAGKHKMTFLEELEKAVYFYDGALVTQGRRNPAWGTKDFTLLELPNKNQPGEWSKKYIDKIKNAQLEIVRSERIKGLIKKVKQEALRNRYSLDIYEQINHLQIFPSQLIEALYQYDKNPSGPAKDQALQKVKEICNYFPLMRKNVESVYSKTRFLNQPEGYVIDLNHHNHLAAKTLNSDWMFLYEIPMVEKTEKWLNE